tara:strand:+ start:1231 stop:1467 length:237 start_codon:yes stop_codon:yes gene_type:complete
MSFNPEMNYINWILGEGFNPAWEEYYIFLEILRESGVTNMFGASRYLVKHYDLDKKKANDVLRSWMRNYDLLKSEGVI